MSDNWRDSYVFLKTLPDGRLCGVRPLIYHWTVHIDLSDDGYEDRYCFPSQESAIAGLRLWEGEGDMIGWHKHPKTGRRRDPATGRIWID